MNIYLQEQLSDSLPKGFTVRGANMDDIEPAMALFNRWSRSVIGRDEFASSQFIRNEWMTPGVDPAEDIRLVFAPNGELAAYIEAWTTGNPPVHPAIWARVSPEYEDMGISTWMMGWAEQRALQALERVPAGLRFAPHVDTYRQAEKATKLFDDFGYRRIRSTYYMLIEMEAPVPEAEFPKGIVLRTFDPETDVEAVYRAQKDSFSDHFGYVEEPFEEGLKRFKHHWLREDYDPSLLFLAMDGDEIAGSNLCRPHSYYDSEIGWVGSIGVRRQWRKRGIGLALLRHSFNEFYRRGKRKVGLGVDAQNLTGALRLYENAGMRVAQAVDRFEKELRPGKEISVQSL